MPTDDQDDRYPPSHEEHFDRIRAHAFNQLDAATRETTNLHLDRRLHPAGALIGPEHQEIRAERDTFVVFADHDPMANFGHRCTYFLYDAGSGDFYGRAAAKFPPFADARPESLEPFHAPVQFQVDGPVYRIKPILPCPIIWPDGDRWAILYSGMSNKRHLNDMEFLYRTLVDRFGFAPDHIFVCNYDCSLNTQDGLQVTWPGDNTPYRMPVNFRGNQTEFESAVDAVKARIGREDLLLVHTNNHGDYDGTPGSSFLCTYPNWGKYYASDFAAKLGQLPAYRKLIVMMEQCNSGGFNNYIIANSTADATSVASAAIESQSSYVSADGNWDPFARDWIAAQAGHTPFGTALSFNPDTDGDGRIEAEEAFSYAYAVRDLRDSPNFTESSEAGGDIALGQEYIVWWWWCWILRELLEPEYLRLPIPEYYRILNSFQPELAKLVAELERRSETLEREFRPVIAAALHDMFGSGNGQS